MNTEFPTKNGINRQWHLIDAQDVVLGKLASKAAMVLMGKTKPTYTPFIDAGDHVVVAQTELGRARSSSVELRERWYAVFTLRDGKILRLQWFGERAQALAAAGLPG